MDPTSCRSPARARAAARPSRVPATMSSRMNSARAAKTWNTRRPPGVVVSRSCFLACHGWRGWSRGCALNKVLNPARIRRTGLSRPGCSQRPAAPRSRSWADRARGAAWPRDRHTPARAVWGYFPGARTRGWARLRPGAAPGRAPDQQVPFGVMNRGRGPVPRMRRQPRRARRRAPRTAPPSRCSAARMS